MTALAIRNAEGVMLAHPAADLFPMMDPESRDFRDFVGSIKLYGLLEPIVLDGEGRILDGRNRFAACEQAGIKPTFIAFADLKLSDCDEFEYVWSRNITRRNLSPDVRLAISVELHRLHGEALQAAKVAAGRKGAEVTNSGGRQVQESSPADSAPLPNPAPIVVWAVSRICSQWEQSVEPAPHPLPPRPLPLPPIRRAPRPRPRR